MAIPKKIIPPNEVEGMVHIVYEPRHATERDIPIRIDHDIDLHYEKKSMLDNLRFRVMNFLVWWVTVKRWLMPATYFPFLWIEREIKGKSGLYLKINSFFVDGASKVCRQIRDGAATWLALNVIVRFDFRWFGPIKLLNCFWLKIRNARAVRNRNKLVAQKLVAAMEDMLRLYGQIVLVSVAHGSFEAVLDACRLFIKEHGSRNIRIFFIDQNRQAVQHMAGRIQEDGLNDICVTRRSLFLKWGSVLEHIQKECKMLPNIVEMAGLFDHIDTNTIVGLSLNIREALPNNGYFITAHVAPNEETIFLETVLEWYMNYRSPEELGELMAQAGFHGSEQHSNPSTCEIIGEPEKIHYVAVCRK